MTLVFHYFLTLIVLASAENPHLKNRLYSAYNVTKITYLVHKYQPTWAPCKYGVQFGFDQPHFVADPQPPFKIHRECCAKCETFVTKLKSNVTATMCCMPHTPYRHGTGAHSFGGDNKKDPLVYLSHPLSIVFDSIVPGDMKTGEYRVWVNKDVPKPRVGTGAWAYAFLGAGFAQTIVFILVFVFYRVSFQRIHLETVADCDYEVEQVKVFNPSKSAMMSDNMNSDLMSMTQAAP